MPNEEIAVELVSKDDEEDVIYALKELYEEGFVQSLPVLVSRIRVTQRGAYHLCNLKQLIPSRKEKCFLWLSVEDCLKMFKDVKMQKGVSPWVFPFNKPFFY